MLDERIRGLRSDGDDYLTKPFAFDELLARIEALARRAGQRLKPELLSLDDPILRAALEQALRSPQRDERLSQGARYAIDEIDSLIAVLDKLLQIAEAESGVRRQSFEPLALLGLLDDIVALYQPAAESLSIHLRCMVDGDPWVLADRHLLAGVLANLLDNAFKYAGEGARVEVLAVQQGAAVRISVKDNGPGIPETALSRATERFFRVDASRHQRGNGLGLSIVAAVVALHRSQLTLENTSPGLKVDIALPAASLSTP